MCFITYRKMTDQIQFSASTFPVSLSLSPLPFTLPLTLCPALGLAYLGSYSPFFLPLT